MSGPPGLHCVLALCHCIACRPQTHVQETFLYSQLATRQRYLHLLQMYANATLGRGSNSSTDTYTALTLYRRLHRNGLPQEKVAGLCSSVSFAMSFTSSGIRGRLLPQTENDSRSNGLESLPERLLVFPALPQWKHMLKDHKSPGFPSFSCLT